MYCAKCGFENEPNSQFCSNCGEQLKPLKTASLQAQSETETQEYPPNKVPYAESAYLTHEGGYATGKPQIRSYIYWMFISIITLGIGAAVYEYRVCQDLRNLDRLTAQNHKLTGNRWYKSTDVDPFYYILGFLFFSPAYYVLKFEKLASHLRDTHGINATHPLDGNQFIQRYIFMIIFSVITVGAGLLFVIPYSLYLQYKWQEALNAHIRLHGLA